MRSLYYFTSILVQQKHHSTMELMQRTLL